MDFQLRRSCTSRWLPKKWPLPGPIRPIWAGLILMLLAMVFSVYAVCYDSHALAAKPDYYLSYSQNLSWSVSLLVLFPAFFSLTLYFYQKAPRVLKQLYLHLAHPVHDKQHKMQGDDNSQSETPKDEYQALCAAIEQKANSCWVKALVLILVLGLNFLYFHQVIDHYTNLSQYCYSYGSWMIQPDSKGDTILGVFSLHGFFAALLQCFVSFWVVMFIVRSLVFTYHLYIFFNDSGFNISLNPLHPDTMCGLGELGRLAVQQAGVMLVIGCYVSLKFIDKIYIQHASLLQDIGNPVILLGYTIVAPLLFFSLLGAAHHKMREAKEKFLKNLCDQQITLGDELRTFSNNADIENNLELLEKAHSIQQQYAKSILVWPFNWKSLQGFFLAVIVPLLPTLAKLIEWSFA